MWEVLGDDKKMFTRTSRLIRINHERGYRGKAPVREKKKAGRTEGKKRFW